MIEVNLLPCAERVYRCTPKQETTVEVEDLLQVGLAAYAEALPRGTNGRDTLARRRAEGAMWDYLRAAHRHRVVHEGFTTHRIPSLPRKVRRAIRGMRKTERDLIGKYLGRETLSQTEMVRMWRYKKKLARFVTGAAA